LLGIIDLYLSATRDAEANLSAGLALCRDVSDTLHAAYALIFLGGLVLVEGDQGRASALFENVLATAQIVVDQRLSRIVTGISLVNLAVMDRLQGNEELASDRLREALHLQRDVGYISGIILILSDLGDIARDEGDFALAFRHYQDALGQIRESTDTRVIIDTIESVGTVAIAVGLA